MIYCLFVNIYILLRLFQVFGDSCYSLYMCRTYYSITTKRAIRTHYQPVEYIRFRDGELNSALTLYSTLVYVMYISIVTDLTHTKKRTTSPQIAALDLSTWGLFAECVASAQTICVYTLLNGSETRKQNEICNIQIDRHTRTFAGY